MPESHSLSFALVCLSVQAIKDGVIDAFLDHAHGALVSKETTDVYSTSEPQQAFHKRISFCLDVHNEAVKVRTPLHRRANSRLPSSLAASGFPRLCAHAGHDLPAERTPATAGRQDQGRGGRGG